VAKRLSVDLPDGQNPAKTGMKPAQGRLQVLMETSKYGGGRYPFVVSVKVISGLAALGTTIDGLHGATSNALSSPGKRGEFGGRNAPPQRGRTQTSRRNDSTPPVGGSARSR
jgi:hypothetical protein